MRRVTEECRALRRAISDPKSTIELDGIFKAKSMDVVFILTSDEYHTLYTIVAVQAGKNLC